MKGGAVHSLRLNSCSWLHFYSSLGREGIVTAWISSSTNLLTPGLSSTTWWICPQYQSHRRCKHSTHDYREKAGCRNKRFWIISNSSLLNLTLFSNNTFKSFRHCCSLVVHSAKTFDSLLQPTGLFEKIWRGNRGNEAWRGEIKGEGERLGSFYFPVWFYWSLYLV